MSGDQYARGAALQALARLQNTLRADQNLADIPDVAAALANLGIPPVPGSVTSVDLVGPVGFTTSGGPVTTTGILTFDFDTGYALPLAADVQKGIDAFGWGNHASAGYLTAVGWGDLGGTLSDQIDLQTALDAKVAGPASATDNALARFDSTTGKLVQDSGVIVDDSNNITGAASLYASSHVLVGASATQISTRVSSTSFAPDVQINGTGTADSSMLATRWSTGALSAPRLMMARSRSSAVGTFGATNAGDGLGDVCWDASDATQFVEAARLRVLQGATATGANFADGVMSIGLGNSAAMVDVLSITSANVFSFQSGAVLNFNAGNATITHSADLLTSNVPLAVPDDAYGVGWNGSVNVPTKNAVYDKIETLYGVGGTDVAVVDGGTGASTAAAARTNLGLEFGLDLPDTYFIRLGADYTLTSTTASQKLFDTTTNGRLTLTTGVYKVTAVLYLTGMSATVGNADVDILGAGTATLDGQLTHRWGRDAQANTAGGAAGTSAAHLANFTGADNTTVGAGTGMYLSISGMFACTVAGTLIPSIALTTAAAAAVKHGSFFLIEKMSASGTNSKGAWD